MTRKQSARKGSDKGQFKIDPSDRKAALLHLPLKTHIDMVTLTLHNLDVKLDAMRETNDEMSGTNDEASKTKHSAISAHELELVMRLSERLMAQKVRIDREIEEGVAHDEFLNRHCEERSDEAIH